MVVRPGIVAYPAIYSLVRVSGPFCPELPDGPIVFMFGVEKGDKAVEGISVGSLGIALAGARTRIEDDGCQLDSLECLAVVDRHRLAGWFVTYVTIISSVT